MWPFPDSEGTPCLFILFVPLRPSRRAWVMPKSIKKKLKCIADIYRLIEFEESYAHISYGISTLRIGSSTTTFSTGNKKISIKEESVIIKLMWEWVFDNIGLGFIRYLDNHVARSWARESMMHTEVSDRAFTVARPSEVSGVNSCSQPLTALK